MLHFNFLLLYRLNRQAYGAWYFTERSKLTSLKHKENKKGWRESGYLRIWSKIIMRIWLWWQRKHDCRHEIRWKYQGNKPNSFIDWSGFGLMWGGFKEEVDNMPISARVPLHTISRTSFFGFSMQIMDVVWVDQGTVGGDSRILPREALGKRKWRQMVWKDRRMGEAETEKNGKNYQS